MNQEPLPYDLKPLTPFVSGSLSLGWLAIFLLLGVVGYLLWRRFKLTSGPTKQSRFSLTDETLRLDAQLRQETLPPRHYTSQLSLVLRSFLESQLQLPASDLTVAELVRMLKNAMEKRYCAVNSARRLRAYEQSVEILQKLEYLSFADTPIIETQELLEFSRRTRQLGDELESLANDNKNAGPIIPSSLSTTNPPGKPATEAK